MSESVMKEIQQHQGTSKPAHTEEVKKQASQAEAKSNLDALSQALAHIEAQTLSGAPSLTPKEVLLDLSDLKAKHPDKHFRWVNIKAPGNADRRRLDGYIRLPESDGGRELGSELAVFVTTKRIHDHKLAQLAKANEARLRAHRAEVENVAEGVARELRDRYGIKVDLDRIFVNED